MPTSDPKASGTSAPAGPAPKRFDVVKVPFPYTARQVWQRRPALVLARHAQATHPDLLWVLMVTSAENRGWPGDVPIQRLDVAGLPAPSIVRTRKLATIEAADALPLGRLDPADAMAVAAELRTVLGWLAIS